MDLTIHDQVKNILTRTVPEFDPKARDLLETPAKMANVIAMSEKYRKVVSVLALKVDELERRLASLEPDDPEG